MRVLITGINGFAGSHLAEYLLHEGFDVSGTVLHSGHDENIAPFREKLRIHPVDILNPHSLEEVINEDRPQQIYHLAGISFVKETWDNPLRAYEVNFLGTVLLYEAIKRTGFSARILFAGSAEVYGHVERKCVPFREEFPLRPMSPYAVSKAAAELLSYQYSDAGKFDIFCARAFNHIGPKQDERFVCSSFARQISEIEAGKREPVIRVGNLEAKRDFTDVRDIVRAYRVIMEKGKPGEFYNVCSGESHSIQVVLDMMLKMSKAKIEIQVDQSRLRSSDIPVMVGDNSKIVFLGWKKVLSLEKSLEDILNYWRRKIGK